MPETWLKGLLAAMALAAMLAVANAQETSAPASPPTTIKELIERHLGPIRKPPPVIRRCRWPCERSA